MRRAATLLTIVLLTAGLAVGCGKKGPPKPPEPAKKTEQPAN